MTVVAVLGAGSSMGSGIARNITRAGMGLRAWNRTREKAAPLVDDGAVVLDSPAEAADAADVIVTMLAMPKQCSIRWKPRFLAWATTPSGSR